MADLTTLNSQFLISLSIIFIGWMLRYARIVDKEGGKSLARIIFNVTLPLLILRMFTRIQMDFAMIVMPLLAFLITGVVFSAALERDELEFLKGADTRPPGGIAIFPVGAFLFRRFYCHSYFHLGPAMKTGTTLIIKKRRMP